MISLPFRRYRRSANIAALYGMIVAQAREPAFYRAYGVPDTVEGRLDMIVLHLVLLLRALAQGPAGSGAPADKGLSQEVFDHFCQDIDGNLREMGIGDLAVPKHMQRVGEAFYGRAKAYESALDEDDVAALEVAVARNVFGTSEPAAGARRLATYMVEARHRLAAGNLGLLEPAALARAKLDFPHPETVMPK
jgi:cytochrome b pre-mRNA-processing protein 3